MHNLQSPICTTNTAIYLIAGLFLLLFVLGSDPISSGIITILIATLYSTFPTKKHPSSTTQRTIEAQPIDTIIETSTSDSNTEIKNVESSPPSFDKMSIEERLEEILTQCRFYTKSGIIIIDIAKITGCSKRALSEYLNSYGQNFNGWINYLRIEYAKEQIDYTGAARRTMEEISDRCGFATRGAFSREFKRVIGMTPHQYRIRKPLSEQ